MATIYARWVWVWVWVGRGSMFCATWTLFTNLIFVFDLMAGVVAATVGVCEVSGSGGAFRACLRNGKPRNGSPCLAATIYSLTPTKWNCKLESQETKPAHNNNCSAKPNRTKWDSEKVQKKKLSELNRNPGGEIPRMNSRMNTSRRLKELRVAHEGATRRPWHERATHTNRRPRENECVEKLGGSFLGQDLSGSACAGGDVDGGSTASAQVLVRARTGQRCQLISASPLGSARRLRLRRRVRASCASFLFAYPHPENSSGWRLAV